MYVLSIGFNSIRGVKKKNYLLNYILLKTFDWNIEWNTLLFDTFVYSFDTELSWKRRIKPRAEIQRS